MNVLQVIKQGKIDVLALAFGFFCVCAAVMVLTK